MENESFVLADINENRIITKCVKTLQKNKQSTFNLVVGFILGTFFAFMVLFVLFSCNTDVNKIKKYSGPKPRFEDYEFYIMNEFYRATSIDARNYVLDIEPADYDFSKFDYNELDRRIQNQANRSYGVTRRNSNSYDRVKKAAEEEFDKDISRRVKEANKVYAKNWRDIFIALGVLLLIYFAVGKAYNKTIIGKITMAEKNKFTVLPVTLVGKEQYRTRGYGTFYHAEVKINDDETKRLRIGSKQYYAFEAGANAWLINWNDGYGLYDDYDVVWNKLAEDN